MPIRVDCPSCTKTFRVDDKYAGKRGKCPACEATVEVPTDGGEEYGLADTVHKARSVGIRATRPAKVKEAEPAEPTPAGPSRTPTEILAAFRGEIAPVRPTLMYRLWILVVAGIMLLLPVLYVAIVGGVVAGLVAYAMNGPALLRGAGRGGGRAALLIYVGPLVAGAIVVIFLLKPLFVGKGRKSKTRALDAGKEPLLFAFVDGVCRSVGSPSPRRIEVDSRVNASASLAGGPLSIGGGLVLTIGLPLVAGLDLRQFAGVLAHEFGHFSQRAGMRLSVLIWSINGWFARVVYERDEWDETLADWSSSDEGYTIVFGLLARLAVWITRRVLWVLMMVGRVVSGFLSRQMEYDADRYEARMVGGETFARTMGRINALAFAQNAAFGELEGQWRERRLPDNLPRLVTAHLARMPEEFRAMILGATAERRTGLFDTHPSDKDRISRARREKSEGIFRLGGPATDLFRDFDAVARSATFDYYRASLGRDVSRDNLYPVEEAVAGHEVAEQEGDALGRVFLGALAPIRPLPLPTEYPAAPADLRAAKAALIQARTDLKDARDEARAAFARWEGCQDRAAAVEAAATLMKVGARFNAAEFGLDDATPRAAEAEAREAESALADLEPSMAAFESAAARRLTVALGMLESDAVADRIPEGRARRDEARALYPCAAHLGGRVVGELPKLLRARGVLGGLIGRYHEGKNEKNQPLINAILRAGRGLCDRLQELKWKVGDALPYPFEHARDDMTLGRFVLPSIPHHEALAELVGAANEAIDSLLDIQRRALGRLAVTTEEVERVLGLKPIAVDAESSPR